LIDNVFDKFGGCVFQLTVGIPMGTSTNCSPLVTCSFICTTHTSYSGL